MGVFYIFVPQVCQVHGHQGTLLLFHVQVLDYPSFFQLEKSCSYLFAILLPVQMLRFQQELIILYF